MESFKKLVFFQKQDYFGFSISSWFSPKTRLLINFSSRSSLWFLRFISGDILLVFFDVFIEYSTHGLKESTSKVLFFIQKRELFFGGF